MRLEEECKTFAGSRQCAGSDNDDDQHYEKCRHSYLAESLDTAGYTAEYDDNCECQEDDHPDHCSAAVAEKRSLEECARINFLAAECHDGVYEILHDVSAERAVECDQEERNCSLQYTVELESRVDLVVSLDSSLLGLTSDSDLRKHQRITYCYEKDHVQQQESESAAQSHLIREGPQVTKTNC